MSDKQSKKEKTNEEKEIIPPLDFSTLVLPFYSQALLKMGITEDPKSKKQKVNMELASRLIDLLDLLEEKTKNNLTAEEEKFLTTCITQLKNYYLQINKENKS
ncbi:MAG: DUF1844 domain-containing protein [Candidatus Aminicenantaceae bacterium]